MAVFLLRITFHNRPGGDSLLLAGRVYPASTAMKAGDRLLFGEIKVSVQEVTVSEYEGVILTVSQSGVETLRRAGILLTKLYGTEIPIESATS